MRVPSQTPFSSFAWILQLLSVHLVIEAPFTPCLILHFTGACPPEVSGALETACGIWNTIRWDAARNCAATVVLPLPFPPSLPHPPGAYSRWGGSLQTELLPTRLYCSAPHSFPLAPSMERPLTRDAGNLHLGCGVIRPGCKPDSAT